MSTILIVDDEEKIVSGVKRYFEHDGFQVLTANDGLSALEIVQKEKPDLMILDLMLPGMDGLEVCRELRRTTNLPIIILSARVEESDKLVGLELGADDYITKPFSPRELVARAHAVLRRINNASFSGSGNIEYGNLKLDTQSHQCYVKGHLVQLTPIEFDLLEYMLKRRRQVCSRSQLLEAAHLGSYDGVERTVDVHIHNLRKKIEAVDEISSSCIQTVFGIGYRFADEERDV